METEKVLVAMSGGVDSSVAAKLLTDAGFSCIGCTMKLYDNEDAGIPKANTCCSLDDVEDARSVAYRLGMPYYVFNLKDKFAECVIDRFVDAYEHGITPNPCIDCNKYMKFRHLLDWAAEHGMEYVVTGHYARVEQDAETGRWLLKKGLDEGKDQSYVLYNLTQEQLAHIRLPLGALHKTEVRKIAQEHSFINAQKHDSQDICFVPDGDYARFMEQFTGKHYPAGDFLDERGRVVGKHRGAVCYTLGQRKGLGFGGGPWFVVKKDVGRNVLYVSHGYDPQTAYKQDFRMHDFHVLTVPIDSERVTFKIRHTPGYLPATVEKTSEGIYTVHADAPIHGVAPGQFCVVYDEQHHRCFGSGEITL